MGRDIANDIWQQDGPDVVAVLVGDHNQASSAKRGDHLVEAVGKELATGSRLLLTIRPVNHHPTLMKPNLEDGGDLVDLGARRAVDGIRFERRVVLHAEIADRYRQLARDGPGEPPHRP